MTVINLNEAKAHLGKYVALAAKGKTIVICERNRPVAELRAIPSGSGRPLRLGVLEGQFVVPQDFNEPVEEFERDFYSGDIRL